MTQQKSSPRTCRISTLLSEDSLVRAFQSLENDEALKTPEEPCSLKLLGSLPLRDLAICCLKMYPDCYRMTKAGHLRQSSVRWMNWGTMSHGNVLTARILESPKPEKECSLSDFLEPSVPEEYCLSQTQIQKLLSSAYPGKKDAESTLPKD